MKVQLIALSALLALGTTARGVSRSVPPSSTPSAQPQIAKTSVPAAAPAKADFSRYQAILDRQPFGVPPAPAVAAPPPGPPPGPPPESFTKFLRMCGITESPDGLRVGLVRIGQPARPGAEAETQDIYYLRVGETSTDGITLVEANYEKETALLKKGNEQQWMSMSGPAPAAGPGGAGPAPVPSAVSSAMAAPPGAPMPGTASAAALRRGNDPPWMAARGGAPGGAGAAGNTGPRSLVSTVGPAGAAVSPAAAAAAAAAPVPTSVSYPVAPNPASPATLVAGSPVLTTDPGQTDTLSANASYADRLKWRREMREKRNQELIAASTNANRLTGQALREYNLKLIRAGGELGPPLPIPLTPEEDAQLVKEGVLPAR